VEKGGGVENLLPLPFIISHILIKKLVSAYIIYRGENENYTLHKCFCLQWLNSLNIPKKVQQYNNAFFFHVWTDFAPWTFCGSESTHPPPTVTHYTRR